MLIPAAILRKIKKLLDRGVELQANALVDALLAEKENRHPKPVLLIIAKQFIKIQNTKTIVIDQFKRKQRKFESELVLNQLQQIFLFKFSYSEGLARLQIEPPRSVLICGPVGSGKSSILKQFMQMAEPYFKINYINCTKTTLQTLSQFSSSIKNQDTNFLYIMDDVDLLIPNKKGPRPAQLYYFIDQILAINQGHLLMATSRKDDLQQGLKRPGRVDKLIEIENPTAAERYRMLSIISKQLEPFTQRTHGYLPADFRSLQNQLALKVLGKARLGLNSEVSAEDCEMAFQAVQPLSKKQGFATIPQVTWEDVGALREQKSQIYNSIILPIKQKEKFARLNISGSSGLLLFGPPGCGKTMLAKAVAHQAKANFITVKGPQLLSKFVGQSQQAVRNVFTRARAATPCVIFFDQFDALAPRRQDEGNKVSERVVNTLLNELGGFEQRNLVFVIAATNRPDMIDPAILRSGRIQKHLYIPLPNEEDRILILERQLNKVRHLEIDFSKVAKDPLCEGFTGADMQRLVKEAGLQAVLRSHQQITEEDIVLALKGLKPSISVEERMRYEKLCSKIN